MFLIFVNAVHMLDEYLLMFVKALSGPGPAGCVTGGPKAHLNNMSIHGKVVVHVRVSRPSIPWQPAGPHSDLVSLICSRSVLGMFPHVFERSVGVGLVQILVGSFSFNSLCRSLCARALQRPGELEQRGRFPWEP
jgi:hypothetical protein